METFPEKSGSDSVRSAIGWSSHQGEASGREDSVGRSMHGLQLSIASCFDFLLNTDLVSTGKDVLMPGPGKTPLLRVSEDPEGLDFG